MASFNRVILVGNLTRDVELKYLQSGTAVGEFGLAINDRRKTATGEWVEETVFVDITLWGRTAEIAGEYLQKGAPVLIEGRLKYDTWEKEGKKYSKLRVVGDKMQMLGSRQGAGQGNSPGGAGGPGGSAGPNGSNRPAQRPVTARTASDRPSGDRPSGDQPSGDHGPSGSEYGVQAEHDSHLEAGGPEEDIPF